MNIEQVITFFVILEIVCVSLIMMLYLNGSNSRIESKIMLIMTILSVIVVIMIMFFELLK